MSALSKRRTRSSLVGGSTPRSIVAAGLAGGVVLNLVDTPWSIAVMVPRMQDFLDAHHLESSAFTGPWFLLVHFAYMTLVAWAYRAACERLQPGIGSALLVGGAFLLVNRGFGLGNVLIGLLPGSVFLGVSMSFVVGTLLGCIVIAQVLDPGRARSPDAA
jgi:hypothetical protein